LLRLIMDIYSIDTEIPLTRTLSHKGRGNFPSLDGKN